MVFKLSEAQRAMARLNENPDDTEEAIRAITAMSGDSQARCFRRFRRSTVRASSFARFAATRKSQARGFSGSCRRALTKTSWARSRALSRSQTFL